MSLRLSTSFNLLVIAFDCFQRYSLYQFMIAAQVNTAFMTTLEATFMAKLCPLAKIETVTNCQVSPVGMLESSLNALLSGRALGYSMLFSWPSPHFTVP